MANKGTTDSLCMVDIGFSDSLIITMKCQLWESIHFMLHGTLDRGGGAFVGFVEAFEELSHYHKLNDGLVYSTIPPGYFLS